MRKPACAAPTGIMRSAPQAGSTTFPAAPAATAANSHEVASRKKPSANLPPCLLFFLAACFALPGFVHAAFEDRGASAIAAAMGQSLTAVPMGLPSLDFNPAGLGELRHLEAQTGFQRGFQIPAGQSDYNRISGAGGAAIGSWGTLGISGTHDSVQDAYLDRAAGATFATQRWKELDNGYLDWGVTAGALSRTLRQSGRHAAKGVLDLGILYRLGDNQTFGFSVFNLNRPTFRVDGASDRAPLMARIGYAQTVNGFAMSIDATKREPSSGFPASQSLGAGMQYWWNTRELGSWAGRTGLNLSDRSKSLSLGLGWKVLGAQADYALIVPLAAGSRCGNSISLVFRFGQWSPEREFEKILDSEIRLRQDLARILERSEAKQKQLTQEQEQLRSEIESLRSQLAGKTAQESAAKERLKIFEERERRARRSMERIEEERRAAARRSKESLYREDWASYEKLKSQGAPDAALIERLKQLLRQYKETGVERNYAPGAASKEDDLSRGVDLSEANQELLRLLRNRPAP